jgi:Mn2+/Fe2+ NRAMP family transporter
MNDPGVPSTLDTPALPLMSAGSMVKHFGPGMLLMMTGIGTSHLITAPLAGAQFGYVLLWSVLASYVFKYYGFEMAFRFTHATGRSMLDAYATAPGKWPLWYMLVTTLVQSALGQAGRLAAAAAVPYFVVDYYFGLTVNPGVYALVLGVLAVTIILRGRYAMLETLTKLFAGVLCVSSIVVYLVEPAPASAFQYFLTFDAPEGSIIIIAAFLGLLPTGIDVSLQASEWGKAKRTGMGRLRGQLEELGFTERFDPLTSPKSALTVDTSKLPADALEYCRRWFTIGMLDFRLGHIISFVIACIFLLLAAQWIPGSEVRGNALMGEIAGIFTNSVGPWMMLVFLVGAFAATFSTAFNYFDGWPRVVAACCRNLFPRTTRLRGIAADELTEEHRTTACSEYNIYRATMLFSLVAAVAIIAGVNRPVWLILVASALAYVVAPVIFFLNLYYCFTVIPKTDRLFYPSRFAAVFGWLSFIMFTGMTGVLIWDRLL